MPLRRISSADAIENIRHNLFASYPRRNDPAATRLEPVCKPAFSPTFRLDYGDRIFTIGSSIARNMESALAARGFDVVTSRLVWPDDTLELGRSILNSYSATSIENELRWALDPDHPFDPVVNLLEVVPGRFVDPNIRRAEPSTYDRMLGYRQAITDMTRHVRDCRIVIMSLSLSEVWYDTVAKTHLNVSPPLQCMVKWPERFELHVLDFAETLRAIEGAIALLRAHCRGDQRILLTVSPVPRPSTSTEEDVLVVNCYSKAVLRTAAEHVAARHDHIDYFPFYESVTLSERSGAWDDDLVHVRRALMDVNVDRIIEAYEPQSRPADLAAISAALRDAQDEADARNLPAAIRLLEPLRDSVHLDLAAATLYADLCLRLDRAKDALAVLARIPGGEGGLRRELLEARATIHDGKVAQGLSALSGLALMYPEATLVHRMLAETYVKLEQWDDALAAAIAWSRCRGAAKRPDAFAQIARIHGARGDVAAAERAYRAAMTARQQRTLVSLDFVEFLIGQRRPLEAAEILTATTPDSKGTQRRYEQLAAMLPSHADGQG
jgi:hypothetical protein